MSQVPLAPPPPTGGPIDGWLYLLWKRVTAAGQILWSSITPSTSADVSAVVTDETGSPGSLVFSGNPTLAGVNVATGDCTFNVTSTGTMYIGDAANKAAYSSLVSSTVTSLFIPTREGDTNRNNVSMYIGAASTTPIRWRFVKGRGGTSHGAVVSGDSIAELQAQGSDGSAFLANGIIKALVDGGVSSGTVPIAWVFQTGTTVTTEYARIASNGTITLGGTSTAPALKVTPVASQARWIEVTGAATGANPQLATTAGELLLPQNIVLPKTSGKGIQVDTATPSFGWRDIIGQIGVKTSGATDPVWTAYRGSIYAYTFDSATAEAFMVFHIPHDYVPGSDMFIHAHWSTNVVATGNVEWNFDISYADGHGTAGGAADPFIAPITVTVVQQASTTQYGHMIAEVQFTNNGGTGGLIDSNTIQVDGLLLVRIYRIKANAADTLNQAPFVHTADVHYQSTNIGTKQKAPNFYT